jgi:hypothetical protein
VRELVFRTDDRLEDLPDVPQDRVPDCVPFGVVHGLECVHVPEHEPERAVLLELRLEHSVERARVPQVGEEIAVGGRAQALDQLAVVLREPPDQRPHQRVREEADPRARGHEVRGRDIGVEQDSSP